MVSGVAACAAVLLALGGGAVRAEEEASWKTEWSNGFKVESKDKKFKLKFGGRVQADYTFTSADSELEAAFGAEEFQNGFEFRRARLFAEGTIYERVKFKAQYDLAGGDADFKDVYVGLLSDWGEVRFGHFKEYFSLEELTSSKYLAFLERSLPIEAFAPSRNSGVGVHASRGDKVNWGVGAFYDADDFGVSTDEDNFNVTGRVAFRPIHEDGGKRMLHVGVSATQKDFASTARFRARPEAHFTTRLIDSGRFAADSARIVDVELAGVFNRFWFAGEVLQSDVDAPLFGDPTFGGYYAQAGFFLTDDHRRYKTSAGAFDRQKPGASWLEDGGKGAWEIAVRMSSLDLTDGGIAGGEQDDVTVGLNWYPNPATRLMINLVHADADLRGQADFVLVRWQVDF